LNLQIYIKDISQQTDFEVVNIKKLTKGDFHKNAVASVKSEKVFSFRNKTYVGTVISQITFEEIGK